ncbi:MAG TPA: M20/M25/M40 family metallo-hydrolase [Candidatus Thermoplasmatota archaeon]|nr:M20/M25/M40 family metallo-hydrolase [Candidatus Thermoplasmatota archaeon]
MNHNCKRLTAEETIDLLTLTKQLIRIPSSVTDGDEIYKYTEDYLKNNNLPVVRQTIKNPYITYHNFENLYVKLGNGNGPKIMLNGHLDTVDVQRPERWKHPPFAAVEEDGRIYGRGAADMKGGMAAAISALIAFSNRKPEFNGEVFLSCVFGEEAPFSLGADTLLREYCFDDYDLIVITEPSPILSVNDYCFTHDKIHETVFPASIVGAEGRVVLEIEFFGRAAHASHPSRGINALHDAAVLISELAHFDIFTNIKRGRGHYVVLNIEGGDPTFTVPEYCRVLINRQIMLGEDVASIIREIEKIVKALRLKSKVQVYKRHSPDPSLEYKPYVNQDSTYLKRFFDTVKTYNSVFNVLSDTSSEHSLDCRFTTRSVGDFNLFGTRTKAPTLVFGPGGGNIHAPDEYVHKQDIIETANYLLSFLMSVYHE